MNLRMRRATRRALTSWIACLAMLFGTLAPGLAHAFLRATPQTFAFPICSAAGHAAPVLADHDADPGTGSFKHCPFCADHQPSLGLPPPGAAALIAVGGPVLPALFYRSPQPLFHWAAPLSRAPPAAS